MESGGVTIREQDFEKLGVFYLGRLYDTSARQLQPDLLLYDSKDLVTHAVVVGMTGSGKTGLCISLLEEAAIDGIPAILIDPKGDLPNLLLSFPELRPADFEPWINLDEARRKEMTPQAYAEAQAKLWRDGLAQWGQTPDRIKRLRDAAEFAVYTPGSSAGRPISIVRSFAVPEPAVMDDREMLHERIVTTVTSMLGLIGVEADPIQSREHILLSNLLAHSWDAGRDLDLAALITLIQEPPMAKVGVLEMEAFFPAKARFDLAMRLNNLLAAPGFATWLSGDPLDIQSMLYTPAGKPKLSIVSIAHLGDAERMFFISLLLNQMLGWMRQQSGTTSLRAILYMDEIFGYLPPVANPPSKAPMLTLLKQARAFGLGCVLATQNPVDLDYKALANCGTWFIGRLQTERDKARLLEGLEGALHAAGANLDRSKVDTILSGLGARVFLMNNVHDGAPVTFHTRWAMSYLRGPLTRTQIKLLNEKQAPTASGPTPAPLPPGEVDGPQDHRVRGRASGESRTSQHSTPTPQPSPGGRGGAGAVKPAVPPDVEELFLPMSDLAPAGNASIVYEPRVLGVATVYLNDARRGVSEKQEHCLVAKFADAPGGLDWREADECDVAEADLAREPEADGAMFAPLPPDATKAKHYALWQKSLAETLYRSSQIELLRSPTLKELSRPGEPEQAFRVRLQHKARELRDALKEKLRKKYEPKLNALQLKRDRAAVAVRREEQQASAAKVQTGISIGATILGAIFGRRSSPIGRATTAARGAGRTVKEWQDIERAQGAVTTVDRQILELNEQFEREVEELEMTINPATEDLETVPVRPKKTDISVRVCALAWVPRWE